MAASARIGRILGIYDIVLIDQSKTVKVEQRFYNTDIVPDDVKKLYERVGGNPTLDGAFNALDRGHTVFAQVFSGMDVVDKIAAVETDPLTNKPVNDVIIDSIEITAFK